MCGDRIVVYLRVEDEVVRDVSFEGSACAIAIASASLMTEAVTDQTLTRVNTIAEGFRRMLLQPGDGVFDGMGQLAALGGVRQFPLRVKCACLPWQALHAAVDHARAASRA